MDAMEKPVRLTVDVWFEFASPYSYLAVMRMGRPAHTAGIDLVYRPFLLGPIFKSQGWDTSPFKIYPAKGQYMWRDCERLAADLGLPFKRPPSFPVHSVLTSRVALVGLSEPPGPTRWGEKFCRAAFRAGFGEGLELAEAAVIADILTHLGVAPEPVLEAAQTPAIKDKLREETAAAQKHGIFGAPTFVTADGEIFWGNDRLEQAFAWARRLAGHRLAGATTPAT
ncbi:2-hydroxychromene-2-carboxylate isomerase [Rhodovulum sp. PH10]|uniref:2-hydroxychromene-2-carboxylate isomerase n=1 Tax=Rhodovulum sp. PH10 TaxID=1187851 RepID=UPI00027C2D61|nr:2-hydroxychromene-2-carboxylate isomerase [Rhodovulum sp. PH10]EJW09964.1 2-hydroxychromene-2-carboxylate isomerase [Rhodovulum sp. PH10]